MKIISAGRTEKGLIREQNQDFWRKLSVEGITILAVADGNGGAGGEELAKVAVETSISSICLSLCQSEDFTKEHLTELGITAIEKSTRQVAKAKELNEWLEAGTTMTLLMLNEKFLYLFWVGDSPCYLFNGSLIPLINPHNLAEMLIEQGHSRESIEAQPCLKSVLTRCLGHDSCEPDMKLIEVVPPFCIIAGSDGVFNFISEKSLEEMAKAGLNDFDAEKLCGDVIQTAFKNGSDDNCTLVVALALPEVSKRERRMTKLYEWRE